MKLAARRKLRLKSHLFHGTYLSKTELTRKHWSKITSCSVSMMKLNQFLVFCAARPLKTHEWKSLKKKSWKRWESSRITITECYRPRRLTFWGWSRTKRRSLTNSRSWRMCKEKRGRTNNWPIERLWLGKFQRATSVGWGSIRSKS